LPTPKPLPGHVLKQKTKSSETRPIGLATGRIHVDGSIEPKSLTNTSRSLQGLNGVWHGFFLLYTVSLLSATDEKPPVPPFWVANDRPRLLKHDLPPNQTPEMILKNRIRLSSASLPKMCSLAPGIWS